MSTCPNYEMNGPILDCSLWNGGSMHNTLLCNTSTTFVNIQNHFLHLLWQWTWKDFGLFQHMFNNGRAHSIWSWWCRAGKRHWTILQLTYSSPDDHESVSYWLLLDNAIISFTFIQRSVIFNNLNDLRS